MISLVLEDMTFEQDIRELLMAFYPGEKYIYTDEDSILSLFLSKDSKSYNIKIKSEDNVLEFISPLRETKFDTKNDLKRNIYEKCIYYKNENSFFIIKNSHFRNEDIKAYKCIHPQILWLIKNINNKKS